MTNHLPTSFPQQFPYQPRPHVSFSEAIKKSCKYMWHFSGRASRSEFWKAWALWTLVTVMPIILGYIVFLVLVFSTASSAPGDSEFPTALMTYMAIYAVVGMALGLAYCVLTLSLGWRRLQDAGFPGALWLLTFIGVGLVPLIMCMMQSSPKGVIYDAPLDLNRP